MMKSATLRYATGADFEQRRRALQRREMDEAYKKNAKYAEVSKNSLNQVLENLLSGEAEKNLHVADMATQVANYSTEEIAKKMELPEWSKDLHLVKQAESINNPLKSDEINPSTEVATRGLSPVERSAIEDSSKLNTQLEESEPSLEIDIPERFQKEFQRDVKEQTVFGRELESLLVNHTFNKAKANYSTHIEMVKNGYRILNSPTFSQIA